MSTYKLYLRLPENTEKKFSLSPFLPRGQTWKRSRLFLTKDNTEDTGGLIFLPLHFSVASSSFPFRLFRQVRRGAPDPVLDLYAGGTPTLQESLRRRDAYATRSKIRPKVSWSLGDLRSAVWLGQRPATTAPRTHRFSMPISTNSMSLVTINAPQNMLENPHFRWLFGKIWSNRGSLHNPVVMIE